ncbi:---NA---, partial [Pelobates cultripes]
MRKGVTGHPMIAIIATNEGKRALPEIPFRGSCYYCNKIGHRQKECRKAKINQRVADGWHAYPSGPFKERIDQKVYEKIDRNEPPDKT